MEEYQEFMVFEIEDSGDRNKIVIDKEELSFYLEPEKVIIIVREDLRRIYLWKGAKSNVRKRFLGSRIATELQGELMKSGLHRCKIVSIDQGDEAQEFLNVFGLETMEVTEKLEDKVILRNSARERLEQQKALDTKFESSETSKLDEIKKILAEDENMLWIKSTILKITKNWLDSLLKNKNYKNRINAINKMEDIEGQDFETREVLTNKRIITNSKLNEIYDFSNISNVFFNQEGPLAILNLKGLTSFVVEESKGVYDIWFYTDTKQGYECVFLFEGLSIAQYHKLLDIFILDFSFRPEIPKEVGRLTFLPK
ncbi:MAG: hypothetical protein ACFE8N_16090 [Promethearchaeota archaeon]